MGIGGSGEPGGGEGGPDGPAILLDVGGVLSPDHLTAAAAAWGDRLGMRQHAFLAALFAGNDDQVLIGRTGQEAWWRLVRRRLGTTPALMTEIRRDLAARQRWDAELVAGVGTARPGPNRPGQQCPARAAPRARRRRGAGRRRRHRAVLRGRLR
ncbi:hypothetical protein O1L55_39965 [Streptomyces albulus]|nr:hypothetical protein [Streptomyces noursei]